jgi:membrane-bound inhibitor of C-type lysozyme
MKIFKAILLPSVLVFILSMIYACGSSDKILNGVGSGGGGNTTYSISGTVSGVVQDGVTITLSGASSGSTTTDASGNYSFAGLDNGSYVVTPSLAGYNCGFDPNSEEITINGENVSLVNFVSASGTFYSISGTVSGAVSYGVMMTLSGANSGSAITDTNGNYSFAGLANGSYIITPSLAGFMFTPTSALITINGGNISMVNFSNL